MQPEWPLRWERTDRGMYGGWDLYEGDVRLTAADPLMIEGEPSVELAASLLHPRKLRLMRLLAAYEVRATDDYEDPSEDLAAMVETPEQVPGQFAAVSSDETYNFVTTHATLQEACGLLADITGKEYGGLPKAIFDLDAGEPTGVEVPFQVNITPRSTLHTVGGHTFETWTDGHANGFEVTDAASGSVRYVYLNPSSGADNGAATVFLYEGPDGDAGQDSPVTHLDLFGDGETPTPEEEYTRANVGSIAAHNALDRAVRRLVAQKVKATYPTAVTLFVYGEYNEDGLLHANCERILDADHVVLAEVDEPTEEWEALTEAVDPMLHQVSEEDEDYQGETELDLTEWDD